MADYNISAEITANTKGFESGVKKAQTSSKKLSKSIASVAKGFGKSGLTGAISSAGLALGGIGLAIGVAVKAIKGITKALGECAEAYKVQLKAEQALDTAINNSPYVTGSASKRLKEFASEMQKVSNLGDEEIIPFMTQLIATGRTEAETMKIIKTASDIASSGAMTFDTAVTQLNATLNGNIGRLGQQNAELKGLTEEELKQGKAVDILADKYKGLSEKTVDTKIQLKNAIGDLKETFGKEFEEAMTPMRKFFKELIQGWTDARKARQEYEDAKKATESGTATNDQLLLYYEQQLKYIADEKLMYEGMYGADKEYADAHLKELAMEENKYKSLIATIKYKQKQEEKSATASAEQARKDRDVIALKEEYLKKLALQEAKWKHIEEVTGQQISNEEKINFYQNSLVDLMSQANGQITTNNQLYKDQIKIIERLQTGVEPEWQKKLREQLIERLEADKEEKLAEVENEKHANILKERITVEYNEQIKQLKLEALKSEEQEALKSVKGLTNAEEEKLRIKEYYEKERMKLVISYAEENKKAGANEAKNFVDRLKEQFPELARIITKVNNEILKIKDGIKKVTEAFDKAVNVIKKVGNVLNRIGNVVKGLFQGGVSIFQKLFNFNVNDALDTMLKIEDNILTFFVETLPQLPQFFKSAMSSVSVLLENVLSIITPEKVAEVIKNIMSTIQEYAPIVIGAIGNILSNMLEGIIDSVPEILDTLGVIVEKLAEVIPQLIEKLIELFITILQNPDKLARIVVALIKGMVEIVNVLLRNIGPLLEALLPAIATIILEIIKALPSMLLSLGEALWEAVKGIGKFIVNLLIKAINLLLDGISSAWTWTGLAGIPHIPELATGTNNAQRGIALVGEAGPELVRFNGGEQVLNTRNTQKALAGVGNSGSVFNVTFNNTQDTTAFAMMKQLRTYQRNLAFNGVL